MISHLLWNVIKSQYMCVQKMDLSTYIYTGMIIISFALRNITLLLYIFPPLVSSHLV
jgi:hypothetical protein